MALVTIATPGCGALHTLLFSSEGLRRIGTPTVSVSSLCCKLQRKRTISRNVEECRVRVRGEKSKVMAQTPGTASAESLSMDNFSSVEELKTALLGSLEGVMPHVRRLEQGHFRSSECSQGRS